ncbi:transmembrane protein, putative (macronuclear) [Tetrahymena thermophila SB210]|uniref:Transmembrane protein, putative n=1 Tax=Tetrahymena thermophila (strain SB210) TaxID=312017 RepID=Q237U1_TETTS|nr:transmembrane protein, putative [Tetrahymena thermophila SB210]EAR92650.2 transmembrane protein, putative [Tetrahymena thermophila SB210]|eukprot:XP_001012895.2 transmembrane protein, putative [Tetrahymena thermophila SB210]
MSWLHKFYFFKLKEEINQKLNENNLGQQQQNINMIGVILFDEQMATLKLKLKNQLLATGIFYDYLQSDYINLNQIQIQSINLHKNLLELEKIIIDLFQINPQNIDLQYLTSIFVQVLDIQNRKVSDFIKQALSRTKQKISINKKIQEQFFGLHKDFFEEDSCMVYCSLIDSSYKINKVSAKFQSIFKFNKDQVIGKPLSLILPKIVKESHSEIVDFCIKYNSNKLQSQRERFSFGLDEKGFVFPLTIRLKFDSHDNDFGACALVSKIKQQKQYILFTDDGTITDFSKKIFVDLFQTKKYNKQDFQFKIDDIIPQINNIIQGGLFQTQFCCPLIFLKTNNQSFEQSTIKNALINTHIQRQYSFKDSIFIIYFVVGRIKTELKTNINFVEIYQYEKEDDEKKKIQIINDLNKIRTFEKKQLENQFLNFEDFDKKKIFDKDSYFEDAQVQNISLQKNFQRREKKGTVKFSLIQLQKQDSYTIDLSSTKHAQESQRFIDQNSSRSDFQENFQSVFANLSDRNLCSLNNYDSPKKLNIQHIQLQKNNNSQVNSENVLENTCLTDKNDIIQKQIQRRTDSTQIQIQTFFNYFEDNTSFMNSNNNYLGNQSSKKQIIKEQSEDENIKEDQINEIASVNSSKYSSDELVKRQIIKRITNNKINGGQRIMIFLGIASFLILTFITMLMHYINIQSLQNYQNSFSKIDEAQNLYTDVIQILSLSNYKSVLSSKKYHFGSKKDIKKEKNSIKEYEYNNVREDYRKNFKNLILKINSKEIYHRLFNDQFNITKYSVQFPDEDLSNTVMIQNLEYTVTEYFYAIVQYIIEYTPTEENFIWENLNLFREKMTNLQRAVENVIQIQFDNMENIQKLILIIFSATNFILGLIIIILSLVINKSKENILKLTGSFQPKCLEKQVQIIELSLLKLEAIQNSKDYENFNYYQMAQDTQKNQHKKIQLRNIIEQIEEINQVQEQLSNKSQSNIIQQQVQSKFIIRLPNKRNRSIASFNSLQKINWLIVLTSVLAFVILLIQPVLNIIISQPYLKEANTMVKERIFLIDINGQMIENLSAHYSNMYMFTVDDFNPSDSYYYQYLVNITDQNQNKVEKLSDFQNSIDIKRNIMNGDICQVRKAYPNFFNSNVTDEFCSTLFNGILQRGLIISFKTVFETLNMLVDIYDSPEDNFDDSFYNFLENTFKLSLVSYIITNQPQF